MSTLFHSKSDSPKTPTLRQWYRNNDGKIPHRSYVKTIFSPSKYSGYSFITEHGFKVVLDKESENNDLIDSIIGSVIEESHTLFVAIVDGSKGEWELERDEINVCQWSEHDWGYRGEVTSARSSKTARSRSAKSKTAIAE